jgi:hypothetical protein
LAHLFEQLLASGGTVLFGHVVEVYHVHAVIHGD